MQRRRLLELLVKSGNLRKFATAAAAIHYKHAILNEDIGQLATGTVREVYNN